MKIPCCYVTIIVDKKGDEIISFPKIIESFIVDIRDGKYIVQTSSTNGHLVSIRKDKVFLSTNKAQEYISDNEELQMQCENAKEWYIHYTKNKKKGKSQ